MSTQPRSCWSDPQGLSVPPGELAQSGNSPPPAQSRGKLLPPHLRQCIQHQSQLGSFPVALERFGLQLHPLGLCHPDGLNHKGLSFSDLADLLCLRLSQEDLPYPEKAKQALQQPTSPPSACKLGQSTALPAQHTASSLCPSDSSGSLTSPPRRSAGCGKLRPPPAASQWLSALSPSG